MLDDALGVEIKPAGGINHVNALNHFSGDSIAAAEWDYSTLIVTVSVRTDERIRCTLTNAGYYSNPNPRTLTLLAEDIETWYLAPGTVMGTLDGELMFFDDGVLANGGGLLHDGSSRLQTLAQLALAWYGTDRSAVSISLASFTDAEAVGTFLTGISGTLPREINTVVTSVEWNMRSRRTAINTEFAAFDPGSWGVDVPGMSDLRSVGRAFNRLQAEVGQLREHAGNLPVRTAAAAPAVRRVIAQEDGQAGTGLSVCFADQDGAAIGDAFDIENIQGANWDDCWPLVATDDLLLAVRVQGTWYGLGFTEVGACA